jgi:hypothetical protein
VPPSGSPPPGCQAASPPAGSVETQTSPLTVPSAQRTARDRQSRRDWRSAAVFPARQQLHR